MSKKWKRAVALVVAVTTMFACTLTVSAEGVKDVFDAKYYADANEDLKAVFGYDENALFNHYMTCGLSEGRCGSPTFDVALYRNAYPDLEAAFGDNWDAYVNHYFTVGQAEGRTAGTPGAANTVGKPAQSVTNVTRENEVYNMLIAQKAVFPEGMSWTNDNYVSWKGGTYSGGFGCSGFAFSLSDAAFGDARARKHTDYTNIRVGDILRVDGDTHSVIVLEVRENSVIVAEGNYNSSVHWGREISKSRLTGEGNYIMTRY